MKKLNKKGFTLIELLAVIVILAIVLVVTIPSVLRSMQQARQQQFNNAVTTIVQYVQQEYDKCVISDASIAGSADSTIITTDTNGNCVLATSANTDALTKAGYTTDDISSITLKLTGSKVAMDDATANSDGKFKNATCDVCE